MHFLSSNIAKKECFWRQERKSLPFALFAREKGCKEGKKEKLCPAAQQQVYYIIGIKCCQSVDWQKIFVIFCEKYEFTKEPNRGIL